MAKTTTSRTKRSGRPGGRPGKQPARRVTARDWIGGARLRTLPLAVAPVALGTGVARANGDWDLLLALLCLAVAVFLQVGVNYSNDYSDGIRGTDEFRVGPARLTGSGAVRPRTVLRVALVSFAVAAVAGVAVVVLTQQWWMLAVGAAAVVAAWFYTGGKRPYGYNALGEVFVFVFFGLVATVGTTFVQLGRFPADAWVAGVSAGLFACAVLMVNNIRDIPQDRAAGKRTLAVVVGDPVARALYASFLLLPFLILVYFGFLYFHAPYVYFTLLTAVPAAVIGVTGKTPKELILALQLASLTALLYGLALAAVLFA
ncbi:1,4-dihydroxy-2-naphthoate octaprenyltransferase [Frigoribacterium sp. PvP120]|uniref:1,4-dihydroxy-2-naphthoate polyprenyltransferase n=1 Tax=Frigoribacterium TaxID=96492 RepID=UPI0006FA900F|nr:MULTISPECIES: 1,4-dihydroxy-2-naphthoate polyprenyltransferase [unclassified Frigoribacterium]MBD8658836.1 1,4-dihydroxy-2-naphthoate polyprenyltransferase [Frigoribacterium sp. CFBP 8754]MBD8727133.1 1,4-dihydroxy-2-naphthoate polyprenyltransferase [Frigoribacterium sp. CFBP 13707]NII50017.1 1,4-dihydroxy-2-naphthoate octaprenyltransferase [Frigoribacterium endophyticum]KQR46389.1 1,4-dihydroxy-2-naphthoate octaprenyltransferase [Frigoribacterium sp. Leaf164]MBP1241138.1 1,4-dihydroxy-2-na